MGQDDARISRPSGRSPDRAAARSPVPPRRLTPGARSRRVRAPGPGTVPIRERGRQWVRGAGPAVVSGVAHLLILLALALLFIARDVKPEPVFIESGPAREDLAEDSPPVEFDAEPNPAPEVEQAEVAPAELPALDVAALVPEPAALDSLAAAEDAPPIDTAGFLPAAADVLAAIGGAGGSAPGDARGGGGAPSGRDGGAAPTFFGKTGKGRSVCFICDNSPSYRDGGFHMVLAEVARAVDSLQPDQSFFVIFYSDAAYPMFHPDRVDELQPATPQNKQRLQAWLSTVEMCTGGVKGLREAVTIATRLGADVVYFLSDGRDFAAQKRCMQAADFGNTVVHTFGMQQNVVDRRTGTLDPKKVGEQQGYNQNLIDIAQARGGDFTPVLVPPQAAAMEQVRPIRKNYTRGAVWGTRLEAAGSN